MGVRGHLKVAQWLHTSFQLAHADATSHDDTYPASRKAPNNIRSAFHDACCNGRLDIIRQLYAASQLTRWNVTSFDGMALQNVCANGHLEIA